MHFLFYPEIPTIETCFEVTVIQSSVFFMMVLEHKKSNKISEELRET